MGAALKISHGLDETTLRCGRRTRRLLILSFLAASTALPFFLGRDWVPVPYLSFLATVGLVIAALVLLVRNLKEAGPRILKQPPVLVSLLLLLIPITLVGMIFLGGLILAAGGGH